jgi:hypothetical protein
MQIGRHKRHNDDMSEQEKPVLEEDAAIARKLGIVLLVVLPIFGFYASSVLGKEWFFDYRMSDLPLGVRGAGYGLILALALNAYIWIRYKKITDEDAVHEWYDPQTERHAGHH